MEYAKQRMIMRSGQRTAFRQDRTSAGDLIGLLGAVQSDHLRRLQVGIRTGCAETVPGLRFSMVAGKFPRACAGSARQRDRAGFRWSLRTVVR